MATTLTIGVAGLFAQPSFAASMFWLSNPMDGNWEASASETNWSTTADGTGATAGAFPGATSGTSDTDTATFSSTSSSTTVTVAATPNLVLGNITFDTASASAYTITGGTIRLSNGKTVQSTATVVNPQAINSNLLINGTLAVTNNATTPSATLTLGGASIKPSNSTTTAVITLGGTNTGLNTVSGVVGIPTTGSESMSITKSGAGTWVLSGTNTYTGSTQVNGGLLAITGATASGSAVTVAAAGTLGGTGTVGGSVDVTGTVAPGVNDVGMLNLGSTLKFEAGSTLAMDLGPTATSADSDIVNFATLADNVIGAGNPTLALSGTINYGATYTILQNTLTAGFTFGGITGYDTADYAASVQQSGNNYVLSFAPSIATPEPASLGVIGFGSLLMLRRRRTM